MPSGGDGVHGRRSRDPNGQGHTNGMYSPPFAFILIICIGLILCIYFDSLHWLLYNLLILCICCCTTHMALVVACTQGSWCVYIKNHTIDPSKQVLTMSLLLPLTLPWLCSLSPTSDPCSTSLEFLATLIVAAWFVD
jgi:hypothetical protein